MWVSSDEVAVLVFWEWDGLRCLDHQVYEVFVFGFGAVADVDVFWGADTGGFVDELGDLSERLD